MLTFSFARSRAALIIALMAFGLIAAGPAALAQPSGETNNCASAENASEPCFSKNKDILQGDRSLLPVDDLLFSIHLPKTTSALNWVLPTQNSAVPRPINSYLAAPPFATAMGRVFNLRQDVAITMTGSGNIIIHYRDANGHPVTILSPHQQIPIQHGLTMADFNGDGFDDIVAADNLYGGFGYFTATDVNDPTQGVIELPGVPGPPNFTPEGSVTSGDLDGDGIPEVIAAYPDTVNGTQGITVTIYRFLRDTSKFVASGSTFIETDAGEHLIVALAGNFAGGTTTQGAGEQIAIVHNDEKNGGTPSKISLTSLAVEVDKSQTPAKLQPVVKATTQIAKGVGVLLGNAKAGRLNWQSRQDQIVVGYTTSKAVPRVAFYDLLGDALTVQQLGDGQVDYPNDFGCGPVRIFGAVKDIAIGNYDQLDQKGNIEVPDTLQVAVLSDGVCILNDGYSELVMYIYGVKFDSDGKITLRRESATGLAVFKAGDTLFSFPAALAAGDLQGRSLVLGPPTKATVVGQIQPDTVLGLPPMQVGWVNKLGDSTQSVLNLTVYPRTYNAQYNFASSSKTQASRKATSSFTYATKESAKETISYGVPDIDQVKITLKQAARQLHSTDVTKAYNSYATDSFRMDASTVFDDLVAATSKRLNIYTYPVIGHCVKKSGTGDSTTTDNGSCPAGEHPLMLQLSAPDEIVHLQPTEASALEWYQPPQQPGQILSYPGSLKQLKQEQLQASSGASALQLLSDPGAVWAAQGAKETVAVNWAQGGGQSVSSGSASTNSFKTSVSLSGTTNIEGVGLSGSATFAYNQSRAASTLNTSATSFDESQGVTLNWAPGAYTPSNDAYVYEGKAYIFGQQAPAGTIDKTHTPTQEVAAQGHIRVGYVADPLSTGLIESGNWWPQAYDLPDVALNHPQRWAQNNPWGSNPQEVKFNCPIGFSSRFGSPSADPGKCVPNGQTPNPSNVADSAFYQMKGLFVTPGTTTSGPQVKRATTGDTVTLRARVYNYSLKNLPGGSTVHVRFYAQPWGDGQFAAGSGKYGFAKAVYIGEDVLNPIPAFCGGATAGADDPCADPNAPLNWVYAKTTWKTPPVPASAKATYWKFWVVAFPESSDGGGLQEMYGHGLLKIPPTDVDSLADIAVQTYSNNVGFYNQVFSVVPKTAPSPADENATKTLKVASVDAEKDGMPVTQVQLNDRVQIRADHRVTGAELDDVMTLFYDGDPKHGGKLFDMQMLPRIPADGDFVTKVPFRPRSCGPHKLFVKAIPMDDTATPDINTTSIDVTMDPLAELARMQTVVQQLRPNQASQGTLPDDWHLSRQMKRQLLSRLWVVQGLFRRGRNDVGRNRLNALESLIDSQRGEKISTALADALDQDINRLLGCLSV